MVAGFRGLPWRPSHWASAYAAFLKRHGRWPAAVPPDLNRPVPPDVLGTVLEDLRRRLGVRAQPVGMAGAGADPSGVEPSGAEPSGADLPGADLPGAVSADRAAFAAALWGILAAAGKGAPGPDVADGAGPGAAGGGDGYSGNGGRSGGDGESSGGRGHGGTGVGGSGGEGEDGPRPFRDEEEIPEACRPAVAALRALGVFEGYPDRTFRPGESLRWGELAAVLYRLERLFPSLPPGRATLPPGRAS
ncbi:MAG: S-layer homology domain-containing protein [Clostridia bacterium]|nr:S-layer homology domain-containing protein [Clostridia bacterium]